jgi:excisionase family DNA binding protein
MSNRQQYPEPGGGLVTKDDPRIVGLFQHIDCALARMELMMKNNRPLLGGELYLTDREASDRLKVSRQTLQDYRDEGKMPYCRIGGKILYRSSDLQRMLDDSYREAYR